MLPVKQKDQATAASSRARGIDRLIDIYRQLHDARRPMSMRELIAATGAPRSTVYELVAILTEAGWLETAGDGSVYFGRAMHYFGSDYVAHNDLVRRAHEVVLALARKHDETVQLCTLEGDKYTVLLQEGSSRPFSISCEIGVKVPIPWTATGRLLLAHLNADEIRALIPDEDFALDNGQYIAFNDFIRDIERAGQDGYCCTEGLSNTYRLCMATPIRGREGYPVAALCFMTNRDTPAQQRAAMLNDLIEYSRKLSQPPTRR